MEYDVNLGATTFDFVCAIEPDRNPDGTVRAFDPRSRYVNKAGHPLHAYGSGPFCKFKIPYRGYEIFGVYALIVDGDQSSPRYIGKAENLAKRFNAGYGNISPKNCFRGGQQTNCRLNTLIYHQLATGRRIDLWFALGGDTDTIERDLIGTYSPPWNRALIR